MTVPTFFRLVTLAEAKAQLSVLHSSDDARIGRLVIDASQMIMDYITEHSLSLEGWTDEHGRPLVDEDGDPQDAPRGYYDSNDDFVPELDSNGDPTYWDDLSVIPSPVRKATLLLISRLDHDREGLDGDPLAGAVASVLARFRDWPVA